MLKTAATLILQAIRQWWSDDVFLYAAAIAFYTIFSLAPILLISVSIAGLVFSQPQVEAQIVREMENLTGLQGGQAVRQVLHSTDLLSGSPIALVVGAITILLGSTAVFANLQASLNHIWQVRAKTDRNALKAVIGVRMRSFGIVLSVGFLLLVSMALSALLNGVQGIMNERINELYWLWSTLNMFISFFIIILLFALIYKYLPDVKITWPDVMTGAVITTVLFSIGKYLIGFYLGKVAIGSTYGAAGSFVVFLIWIYYSSLIFFFGAEFTQVYAQRYGKRIRPEDHAEQVDEAA